MGNYLPPIGHAGWLPDPHITKYVDVCERSAEICQNAAQYIESSIEGATNTVTRLEKRAEEATIEINDAVAAARALVPQIEEDIVTVQGYVEDARAIKADIDNTHDEINVAAGVIAEAVTNAQGHAAVASTAANAAAQRAIDASQFSDIAEHQADNANDAAAESRISANRAATSAATAQELVDGIPSDVADAIEQEDIPGKVQNYLEDEHIAADFEFDTFADYEAAWTAGTVKAGDNVYIKSDERFLCASVDDIVRCTVGDVNDYDNTVLYKVGDYCLHRHRLWICEIESRAVTPVEGAVWSLISLSELNSNLNPVVTQLAFENGSSSEPQNCTMTKIRNFIIINLAGYSISDNGIISNIGYTAKGRHNLRLSDGNIIYIDDNTPYLRCTGAASYVYTQLVIPINDN